ncbi:diguanylate cyclase [Undibacterium sp. LX40W]|uniref:diguanylate cyclase n=1 Tax=Undibacterium nitidum TaxID=2762298 RepID=A0A923HPT2_9BURK|nr:MULTISPECIES: sensor domain-containing diguanylate cyclase [Undibacterium]MBC3880237.1 diguanylate cyclase [Undibacterium nitidum]MBC3891027.1 diguanylate cyclase [Undibacterium sp. LX40W]
MTIVSGLIIERVVAENILKNYGQRLNNISYGVAKVVASNLEEPEREIQLVAKSSHLATKVVNHAELNNEIRNLKDSYPLYAWIGYANNGGVVENAADDLLVGKDVSSRPWYSNGKRAPYVGDLHEAVLLAKLLGKGDDSNPLRFIDIAAPVFGENHSVKGVVAAHVHWKWMQHIIDEFLAKSLKDEQISVLIVDKSNNVISPLEAIGTIQAPVVPSLPSMFNRAFWKDGIEYQFSSMPIDSTTNTQLGWKVIARQPINQIDGAVFELNIIVIRIAASSLLVLFIISYWIAKQISLPLERLSKHADEIRVTGKRSAWKVRSNVPELNLLARSIQAMTERLFSAQESLAAANGKLEATVEERTAELQAANQQLKMRAEELHVLARVDQLTNIPNRRAANEELTRLWNFFRRKTSPYCVIILDIDYFKRVNDTYGHDVGDLTLQTLSKLLKENAREVDTVARFGGEEFLVCLPGTDILGATHVAEKPREIVQGYSFPHNGHLTISLGVAGCDISDGNETEIVTRADAALYEAKNEGRNQVRVAQMAKQLG